MAKRTTRASEPEEQPEQVNEIEASGKDSATVVHPRGERVYSKELHGNDFRKLAQQFADKFGGIVR